jgi:hypothetical protein
MNIFIDVCINFESGLRLAGIFTASLLVHPARGHIDQRVGANQPRFMRVWILPKLADDGHSARWHVAARHLRHGIQYKRPRSWCRDALAPHPLRESAGA